MTVTREEAVVRLDRFLLLEPGWDSYGGKPIRPDAVNLAKSLLSMGGFPCPTHVSASSGGDVGLSFGPDCVIEVDIDKDCIRMLDSRGEDWQAWPVTQYRIGDMSEYERLKNDILAAVNS